MTTRQILLKLIYPLFSRYRRMVTGTRNIKMNVGNKHPDLPFYSLRPVLINGALFDFAGLKGRKVLLVNLASDCGYTPQYEALEKLQQLYKERLVVLGFPANDFKGQEPGTNEEIALFCKEKYAVSFPMFQKHSVLKPHSQEVFKWLSDKNKNGWNDQAPTWNFCKYLVDEKGVLQSFFPLLCVAVKQRSYSRDRSFFLSYIITEMCGMIKNSTGICP